MAYRFAQPDFLSRRALAVAAILALHALAAYLLATGLIQTVIHQDPRTLVANFFRDPDPLPSPPPPHTKVSLARTHLPPVDLPPPPLSVPEAQIPPPPNRESFHGDADPAAALAASTDALRILGKNQMPDTRGYYPSDKIRDNIEGAAFVRVCVDEQGVRRDDPSIEQSSGDAQLDASALNVARHGRYARAMQGGVPVANCYRFRIAFRLR